VNTKKAKKQESTVITVAEKNKLLQTFAISRHTDLEKYTHDIERGHILLPYWCKFIVYKDEYGMKTIRFPDWNPKKPPEHFYSTTLDAL
jgi:hypothetical protein